MEIARRHWHRVGWWAAIALACFSLGCGQDDSGASNGTIGPGDDAASSDAAVYDASGDSTIGADAALSDASIGPDAGDASSGYDPTLSDLGVPGTGCPTPIVNTDADADAEAGTPAARVFVSSYRVDFDALETHRTYREHIHRLIHRSVLPCTSPDRPDAVVFPESMGLPMLLIGPKARAARDLGATTQALTALVGSLQQAFTYYAEKFPGTDIAQRFVLAQTDTVVRATYDTFGQLADRYDLYISVTVNLPDFERTTDPGVVAKLGDPDYEQHDYAYEATSPDIHNRQLLFGPDGALLGETLAPYISRLEIEDLGVSPGDFTDIGPMQTPWGRTGVVISKPAWMPDVQARLDDLGARVYFQPEAVIGGWVGSLGVPLPDESPRWEPDYFLLGGWNLVQRSPRARHNFVAQLTGNFFELPIDGQVQIVEKATPASPADAFVGQRGALSGNAFIGPWVVEDPGVAYPELSLAERRARLRETGVDLLPGSGAAIEGQYVEGMWAYDLPSPPPTQLAQVETHPQVAVVGDTTYVVSSAGQVGSRLLRVAVYRDGVRVSEESHSLAGYDLVRPSLAAGPEGLHIVSELIGEEENRLLYSRFDLEQGRFATHTVVGSHLVGEWAFHPSLTLSGGVLHLSWIKRVGNANRAFYAQTSAAAAFEQLSVNAQIEPRPADRAELRANQWDARVAVDPGAIVVTWLDFRNWQWEVYVAASTDGGLDWTNPRRIDAVPATTRALHATPDIVALGDRRFAVAWTQSEAARPNTRIAVRELSVSGNAQITLESVELIGETAPFDQWMWRPQLVEGSIRPSVVYETMIDGRWSLERVEVRGDRTAAPQTVLDAGSSARHFPQIATGRTGDVLVYEQIGPDSPGASAVEMRRLTPQ